MTDDTKKKSAWVINRDAALEWLGMAFHKIVDFFHPLLVVAGDELKEDLPVLGRIALVAAMNAVQANGGKMDKEAMYQAAKVALVAKLPELGAKDAAALLNSLRVVALNATAQATAQLTPPPNE